METDIMQAKDLSIAYGERVIVDGLELSIARDKITTIIGPNGSGKSTILKAITRLIHFQQGTVYLEGRDILDFKPKALASRIAVLPQLHTAPADFRVKDLVSYGRMPYQKLLASRSREDEEIVEWAMEQTGVAAFKNKSIYEISGGETQRVWIATVLAQKPQVMFLDEPTTYLDIAYQLEMMQLVRRLNRQLGIGVVMVLHDLVQAMEVSDHIVVIKNGRIYAEGAPEEVITCRMMKEVYDVDCEIMQVRGRARPLIAYAPIA